MYTPGAKDNTLPGTINKLVKGCTEDMVRYFVNNKGLKAGGKPGRLIRALTLPELVAWQYLTFALGVSIRGTCMAICMAIACMWQHSD